LIILLILLPKPMSVRVFTVTPILATVLAFILYQASIVCGLSG